jgi:hypothetical protein
MWTKKRQNLEVGVNLYMCVSHVQQVQCVDVANLSHYRYFSTISENRQKYIRSNLIFLKNKIVRECV